MTTLQAALEFARNSWPVLPVHVERDGQCSCGDPNCPSPGKHPMTRHGYKDATTDKGTIERWFAEGDWNLGVATGTKFCAIDLDADTEAAWVTLDYLVDGIPSTMSAKTKRGYHFYFVVEDKPVLSKVISDNPRIELIGHGKYVIVPPSQYRQWLNFVEPRPIPERILKLPAVREHRSRIEHVIRGVPEGSRNVTATQVAGKLLGCFPTEDWHIAWILLEAWNEKNQPPLPERELKRVFDSISKRELKKRTRIKHDKTARYAKALAEVALRFANLSERQLARLTGIPRTTLQRLVSHNPPPYVVEGHFEKESGLGSELFHKSGPKLIRGSCGGGEHRCREP
ncbi:MAG: bifunctional DNA primase/polymerase [Candidatus Caldarchaeum sp.]